jgi:hypothetical protein
MLSGSNGRIRRCKREGTCRRGTDCDEIETAITIALCPSENVNRSVAPTSNSSLIAPSAKCSVAGLVMFPKSSSIKAANKYHYRQITFTKKLSLPIPPSSSMTVTTTR